MNKEKKKPVVNIYSDGGAAPNPGKGGYGVILEYKGIKKELIQGYKNTTNNRMELMGAIRGIESLKTASIVHVYTDSSYVVNAVEKKWINNWYAKNWYRTKTEKIISPKLWKRLHELLQIHEITFHWIKGHNGHPENERCDFLATQAREMESLLIDEEFEQSLVVEDTPTLF